MAGDLSDVVSAALKGMQMPGIVPGGRYALRIDLREYGRHSMLHFGFKHQHNHPHKLELLDTGKMGFSGMLDEITSVFQVDPLSLEIMRVDFAVDIPGVPVTWFREHVRARLKQWAAGIFVMQESEMGRRELQSFYLGKRPNCFRIYNKLKEQEKQYADYLSSYRKEFRRKSGKEWAKQGTKPEYPPPMSFEEMFPPIEHKVLTRVERQIGGSRLPKPLSTVASLKNLDDFNPFAPIEIYGECGPMPTVEEVGLHRLVSGRGYRDLFRELGEHEFRSFLNLHSPGNAARVIREYGAFIYADRKREVTNEILWQQFRESYAKQLVA